MDLAGYWRLLRRSWWLILIGAILGTAGAVAVNETTTPTYASRVTFYVSTPTDAAGGNAFQANQYAVSKVQSYTQLATSERLAAMIIAKTGIEATPQAVARTITASFDLNTVLITTTVVSTSPDRASAIATALSTEFGALIDQLDNRASGTGEGRPTVVLNVVSGPTPISTPVTPRVNRNLGIGFALGVLLGVFAAFVRELSDTTVRSESILEAASGLPILGRFTRERRLAGRNKAGRRSSQAVKRALDGSPIRPPRADSKAGVVRLEGFRQLRTNLAFLAIEHPLQAIVVTSANASEGKSSIASSLAAAFAESGRRTLLLDADLRRPKASEYLGLDMTAGLSNVLLGEVDMDDVLQTWGEHDLQVLAAGATPPNPAELLGGEHMSDLLARARQEFDTIIIDSPPVLPVTDAAVLSRQADGAVLVAWYGRTRVSAVTAAVESLRRVDSHVVGTVLNSIPPKRNGVGAKEYGTYY